MRIIIIAAGTWGDVRPNTVLGKALSDAGYEVTIVASEDFREWVTSRGLAFAGLSFNIQAALDALTNAPNAMAALNTIRSLGKQAVTMGEEIAAVIQRGDTILCIETAHALINGIVEKYGNRVIHINMQPFAPTRDFSGMLPTLPDWVPIPSPAYNRWAGNFIRRTNWWMMGRYGNQLRKRALDIQKISWGKYRKILEITPSLLLVSPHVVPRPDDWLPHQHVTGYLFDEDTTWKPSNSLTMFLNSGEKPVYFGFGSMRDRNPKKTTDAILETIERTSERAIILSGWAGIGTTNLPEHIYLLDYAPHTWLFPHMKVIVHHGGAGTTAAAFRAGVPQIVTPVIADQPFWGRRVHELGVGAAPIPHNKISVDSLLDAIKTVVRDTRMQVNARILGEKVNSEDGLSMTLDTIKSHIQ